MKDPFMKFTKDQLQDYCYLYGKGSSQEKKIETTTFFDYDHKELPVLNAYKYNKSQKSIFLYR